MLIGISTSRYDHCGDLKYKKLREAGFDAFDLSLANTASRWYTCSENELSALAAKEKELAEEAGVIISQTHGPWCRPLFDLTEEDRERKISDTERAIRITSLLGCRYVVVHPFFPFDPNSESIEDHAEEAEQINVDALRRLLPCAKKHGVTVCLENMPWPRYALSSPEAILRLIDAVNDDNLKMCLDTGHVAVIPGLKLDEEVRRVAKVLRVMHIHDNDGLHDYHYMPYYGVIDWEAFGKVLRDIGYEGVFSMETAPHRFLPEPVADVYMRALVKTAECIIGGN